MDAVKLILAAANYAVATLNVLSGAESRELRDWLAALAWVGSGTYWFWQAMG